MSSWERVKNPEIDSYTQSQSNGSERLYHTNRPLTRSAGRRCLFPMERDRTLLALDPGLWLQVTAVTRSLALGY